MDDDEQQAAAGLVTPSSKYCTDESKKRTIDLLSPFSEISPEKESDDDDVFDFDSIFIELGDFGYYQTVVYALMCVAVLAYGQVTLTYVFTAGDLNYR